jgi:hypothetical protein
VSQTIEIESIARLDVKPGETLLVTLPTGLDTSQLQGYRDELVRRLPEGVEILLASDDVEFKVIARRP